MKNRKIKFNAIDFLIVLVILAAVLTIVLRSGLKNSVVAVNAKEAIEYTVRINNVQKASFDILEIGDELYNQNDEKLLGKIVGKDQRPAETYIALDSGAIAKTYIPDRIDIFLTVECPGKITDEGCMLRGSYFIAAGKYISAYTDKLAFSFEVTNAYKK